MLQQMENCDTLPNDRGRPRSPNRLVCLPWTNLSAAALGTCATETCCWQYDVAVAGAHPNISS